MFCTKRQLSQVVCCIHRHNPTGTSFQIACIIILQLNKISLYLRPSINGLVTDGNTKLCCEGFILALFQSTTANKIDSEHTRDYKRLLPVWEAEILRVTVKMIEVFSSFNVDSWRFSAKSAKNSLKGYISFLLMFIKTDKLSINITIVYWTIAFWKKKLRYMQSNNGDMNI